MALHPDFPDSPHSILNPEVRWFPADEAIGDPTLSDVILGRRIHNAYKIALKGESMRKKRQVDQGGLLAPLRQQKQGHIYHLLIGLQKHVTLTIGGF